MSKKPTLPGGGRRRIVALTAAAVLALGGIAAITASVLAQQPSSAPAAASSLPSATGPATTSAPAASAPGTSPRPAAGAKPLPASKPTVISIPAIGVQSQVFTVGRTPDGTMQVPQPGPDYNKAAWYKHSPAPGQLGPSVIIGHVDSAEQGPSVFYRLPQLQPGQKVQVTRADGTIAEFTVDRVENYAKNQFPTLAVYSNTSQPELRLITCGGSFNEGTGNYTSNIVAYAHLTASRST